MRRDDAPAFGQADPALALSAADGTAGVAGGSAFEFERDAGEVAAKADDLEANDGAREIGGGASFAEGFELIGAVEIFTDAEAHDLRAGPKHGDEGVNVIGHQRLFVAGIEP